MKLLKWLLTEGLHAVLRVAIRRHHSYANETRHQFVTKTSQFQALLGLVRNGKARQAKGFSFLSTQLCTPVFGFGNSARFSSKER
jgi:hypothetical protein